MLSNKAKIAASCWESIFLSLHVCVYIHMSVYVCVAELLKMPAATEYAWEQSKAERNGAKRYRSRSATMISSYTNWLPQWQQQSELQQQQQQQQHKQQQQQEEKQQQCMHNRCNLHSERRHVEHVLNTCLTRPNDDDEGNDVEGKGAITCALGLRLYWWP